MGQYEYYERHMRRIHPERFKEEEPEFLWYPKDEEEEVVEEVVEEPVKEPCVKKPQVKKLKSRKTDRLAREEALKRDNYRCQECGSTDDLEVHHIVYKSEHGGDNLDNLITLCPLCHAEMHKGEPIYNLMMARILKSETPE